MDKDRSAKIKTNMEKLLNDEEFFQEQVENAFDSTDADSSENLDYEELKKWITRAFGALGIDLPDEEILKTTFTTFDRNSDGTICKKEFDVFYKCIIQSLYNLLFASEQ
mmetsp:Transcript_14754/g.17070  ORF Transcript_14754/g.17070 Transcript_14754/m.17070 type:complete len:109 (-) Transcript_14754:35-361(-)|eukprot:CAMPEP_0168334166 /NCGR_PEP_ID=MMETSP0213-20121227/10084_1 /TAXON_ID=151035 /ORGANISM="Euplotes harpa, Strain FSP1.4" /LENGTH=108 /DNA_ID=CAMNT_0008338715 /DNA_START=10 /DNA_END=336 /DNA_ORIENTATION=+